MKPLLSDATLATLRRTLRRGLANTAIGGDTWEVRHLGVVLTTITAAVELRSDAQTGGSAPGMAINAPTHTLYVFDGDAPPIGAVVRSETDNTAYTVLAAGDAVIYPTFLCRAVPQ